MSDNNQAVNSYSRKDSILNALEKNIRSIAIALGSLAIIGLGVTVYFFLKDQKALQASEDLFKIQARYNLIDSKEGLKNNEAQKAIEKFIKDNPKSAAAMQAAIDLANYYDTAGSYQEANKVLQLVKKQDSKDILATLYTYRLGMSYQKAANYEEAIKIYDILAKNKTFPFIQAPSLLQRAFCLEKLNRKEEAISALENISSTYGDNEIGKEAEKYLILLKMGA